MREEDFADWEKLHVSPALAMTYFFRPFSLCIEGLLYVQLVGVPLTRYYFSISCIGAFLTTSACTAAMWRFGPSVARNKVYVMTLPICWCCCWHQHSQHSGAARGHAVW